MLISNHGEISNAFLKIIKICCQNILHTPFSWDSPSQKRREDKPRCQREKTISKQNINICFNHREHKRAA